MFSELRTDLHRRLHYNGTMQPSIATGIGDNTEKVIPCWMETGVTLFQEDNLKRGSHHPM